MLVDVAAAPYPDRLEFLLRAFDFAAVDGLDDSELAMLERAREQIGIERSDAAWMRWAILPRNSPAPDATGSLRAVHIDTVEPSSVPLAVNARFTIVAVGERKLLRITHTEEPVQIDHDPQCCPGHGDFTCFDPPGREVRANGQLNLSPILSGLADYRQHGSSTTSIDPRENIEDGVTGLDMDGQGAVQRSGDV